MIEGRYILRIRAIALLSSPGHTTKTFIFMQGRDEGRIVAIRFGVSSPDPLLYYDAFGGGIKVAQRSGGLPWGYLGLNLVAASPSADSAGGEVSRRWWYRSFSVPPHCQDHALLQGLMHAASGPRSGAF